MKKLTLMLVTIVISIGLFSQTPQAFKYQAVVRDNVGDIIANQEVSFRISIRDVSTAGTIIYQETHSVTTNDFGLAILEVGNGDPPIIGNIADIDWGTNDKFLEVELDPQGNTAYVSMGTTQLLAVPYSLYAESTGDTSRWKKNNDDLYFNNGNVGIGTPNPNANLDVRSSGTDAAAIFGLGNSDGSHSLSFFPGREGDPNPFIQWKEGDPLRFSTDEGGWSEKMRIMSDGRVGIGTENPSYKFEVEYDPPSSNINPIALFQTTGSTNSAAALRVQNTSNNYYNFGMTHPGNNNFSIAYNANIGLSADLMTITPVGNVGIATTIPSTQLEVVGKIQPSGVDGGFMFPDGSVQFSAAGGGGTASNTLNQAYNQGGPGVGRKITAVSGAFEVGGWDGVLFTGAFGAGNIPAQGSGTRMMWYPNKSAFRVGTVQSDQWDNLNIGHHSTAMGFNTKAYGMGSTAMGYNATVNSIHSTSIGYGTETDVSAAYSTAIGYLNKVSGNNSFALGNNIHVSGKYSFAIALADQNQLTITQDTTLAIMGGNVGIGIISPTTRLQVADTIHSTIGGFKFPDGTVQETRISEINDLSDGKTNATSVFLGQGSGENDEGDKRNTAIGINTLNSNNTGRDNIATGYQALFLNEEGDNNIATGTEALFSNLYGQKNIATGT